MRKNKRLHNFVIGIAAVLVIVCMLAVLPNICGNMSQETEDLYKYSSYDFFIKNDRGAYTYGAICVPDSDKPYPLVFIAHGFKGTRNSGGAAILSERLAQHGIAAVRIDFNSFKENSTSAEHTNRYTLTDMQADAVKTINYVMDNFDIDEDNIGIYGRSMGGRVAMVMANENVGNFDFKAMALIAPAGNSDAMIYYMGGIENWDDMKKTALEDGFCLKQNLELTYDWFTDFEDYDPSKTGEKFGNKPVLLYYNTLDTVVRPVTCLECADAYSNIVIKEVTSEDGHGYEMSYKESELKETIMTDVVDFFTLYLKNQ